MSRAYSFMQVKAMDDEQRIITGIASTPTPDRSEDIVDPKGAKFSLPMPFLWQHNHSMPIGHVTDAKVSDKGIEVTIQLAKIEEDGPLKQRIDEAWQSIKAGLVKGLSIGFRSVTAEGVPGTWGVHFLEWEWYELSAVTIPDNAECSITSIKSIANQQPAATGNKPADQPATPPAGDSADNTHVIVQLFDPNQGGVKLS